MRKKTVLMVVAQKKFRDEELDHPRDVLTKQGAQVYVAAQEKSTAEGMLGMSVLPDYTLAEAAGLKFDCIVVVGGAGAPEYLWGNQTLLTMLQTHYAEGKPLGAICLAPVVLAEAGLLKDTVATVYKSPESMAAFEKYGVKMEYSDVVVAGTIVTANGPAAARRFGNTVASMLF